MKITSSFKHLEHTPAIDQKIQDKSQKLNKYFEGNFEVQWTCHVRDDGAHCADIKIIGPSFEYHAGAHSETLYKSLDMVISKIERQIQKKKSKWKSNISNKHNTPVKEVFAAEVQKDEQYWADKAEEDIAS
jgi:putative sigma-54 modulation protein